MVEQVACASATGRLHHAEFLSNSTFLYVCICCC